MKRNLSNLETTTFDFCVIGGGVVGACIARDAARRGLNVALVEMNDFASAASEAMSHTIHGGIRYLAQGRLGLVREAISEKKVWLDTAPDFVCDQPFMLPLTGGVKALQMRAGVAIYQRLAGRRAATLNAQQTLETEPCLEMPGLTGSAVYHDARVDDPDTLVRAILDDAASHGACIANHVRCTAVVSKNGRLTGVEVEDTLGRGRFVVNCEIAVNATGPWAQSLASKLLPGQNQVQLTASKGIHLLIPALTRGHAIALSGKGEHAFVLPWKGMSMIGTTDNPYSGDLSNAAPSDEEVERLKQKVARLLPAARSGLDAILGAFGGVRALPGSARDTYRASREVAICDHRSDGMQGFHSVFGGKWTTARLIAETFLDAVTAHFSKTLRPCDTRTALIQGAARPQASVGRLQHAADVEMAVTFDDFKRRLGRKSDAATDHDYALIQTWLASSAARNDTHYPHQ